MIKASLIIIGIIILAYWRVTKSVKNIFKEEEETWYY